MWGGTLFMQDNIPSVAAGGRRHPFNATTPSWADVPNANVADTSTMMDDVVLIGRVITPGYGVDHDVSVRWNGKR
eukprot:scaffold13_cov311-Chaetoceros_neogracile.AAC.5